MTRKPIFVEVYAWNETILGLVALGWGLFVYLWQFESWLDNARDVTALAAAFGGLSLLVVQVPRVQTFLDFRLPWLVWHVLLKGTNHWKWINRIWPGTTLCRVWWHLYFTVWWLTTALAVATRIDDLSDVRLIFYVGFAMLHLDRLIRLLVWVRQ